MSKVRVGIVGYRGYSGAEAVRILGKHSHVEPVLMEHRTDAEHRPEPIRSTLPAKIPCTAEAASEHGIQAVLLATPADVSMQLTRDFLAAGIKVVDLSGAFRLKTAETFTHWYKEEHLAPELLSEAVYGLPEFYRKDIPGKRLVSNPGCYPTAANLAIRPLVAAGVVDTSQGIICDAKSGVSGAGRKPTLKTSFCEATENFSAYSLLGHRHVPEIFMNSGLEEAQISFTAHLLPIDRGILETIYAKTSGIDSIEHILKIYESCYGSEPFVRLYPPGKVPDIRSVARTNFCDIGFHFEAKTQRLVVVAAIDNLVKGAAGQAIQNLNLILGFPETEALLYQ
jgi:N-acetyl-gamma-glutamyl-phosphate reductase